MKKLAAIAVTTGLLSLLPWTVNVGEGQPIVTIRAVCAQATQCTMLDDYICSMAEEDLVDMVCYAGCGPE